MICLLSRMTSKGGYSLEAQLPIIFNNELNCLEMECLFMKSSIVLFKAFQR